EILMRELNKHIGEETQLLFGTAVDGRMGDRLSVTLLSSLPPAEVEIAPPKPKRRATAPPPEPVMEAPPQPVIETLPEPTIESFVEPDVEIPATIEPEPAQPVFQEPEIALSEPVIEENFAPREMPEAPPLVKAQMEDDPAPQPRAPRIIPPKKKPLIAPKAEAENPKREK